VNSSNKPDMVNEPPHYQSDAGIECIDAIEAATTGLQGFEGYCIGNAIKYLWRWKHKGGVQDVEKARWYLNRILDHIQYEEDLAARKAGRDALLDALRVPSAVPERDAYDQVEAEHLRGGFDRG